MEKLEFGQECIDCVKKRFLKDYPSSAKNEAKEEYEKRVLGLLSEADGSMRAPVLVSEIQKNQRELFGCIKDYSPIKKRFNALMLKKEAYLKEEIEKAKDPIKKALTFALTGNYIDFGALASVSEDELIKFFEKEYDIDEKELLLLKEDIKKAKKAVYLTDNCGEILTDKLFISEIKKFNPDLDLTVIVRGEDVLNDATLTDAKEVGLDLVAEVIPNGNSVPGTSVSQLSKEAREKFDSADVIIAKGQGNFETLCYINKNIYYIFLCKCSMFTRIFGVPQFTGMLLNDLRIK